MELLLCCFIAVFIWSNNGLWLHCPIDTLRHCVIASLRHCIIALLRHCIIDVLPYWGSYFLMYLFTPTQHLFLAYLSPQILIAINNGGKVNTNSNHLKAKWLNGRYRSSYVIICHTRSAFYLCKCAVPLSFRYNRAKNESPASKFGNFQSFQARAWYAECAIPR